ncbi:MAG TPA: glycolate oxidase subunit GlcF, partial [Usitatibacter sp.]|nr:glycolate oxidase subunit GlcF [Usitatibacter sp.]
GRLADIGRAVVAEKVARPPGERLRRWLLAHALTSRGLFAAALALGRAARPLLPGRLARRIPERRAPRATPPARHARRMVVLGGCVQPSIAPSINAAAARVLDRLGIALVDVASAGCCGAVPFHLDYQRDALAFVKANIDAWWPEVEAGAGAIVVTASGCGTMVKDYGHLLRDDPAYAQKARRVSELARDVSEVVAGEHEALVALLRAAPKAAAKPRAVAFHSPCSLQHGQKIQGVVESILREAGFALTPVPDAHLCCGSAGTYSILQPALSRRLLQDKVRALESGGPELVATANVGCLAHLESGLSRPVVHWIELLDERLGG